MLKDIITSARHFWLTSLEEITGQTVFPEHLEIIAGQPQAIEAAIVLD